MLTGLDHVIIGVHDLSEAEQTFGHRLGLALSGGGTHPSGGTANRIIVIGDTYLELITVHSPTEAQRSMLDRLALGEGFLNFVLASDDIEAESTALRQRGIPTIGPNSGQLRSQHGQTRGWSRVDVELPDLTQHYPFLIQHDSSGPERRRRLAGGQPPPLHSLGAMTVLSTTIAVADLGEATRRFAHIYGLEPSPSFTGEPDGWDAMLVAFPLGNQEQSFELAISLPFSDEPKEETLFPEPGALAWHLRMFGESLCRITLGVRDLDVSRRYLDEHAVTYTYRDEPQRALWIAPQETSGAAIVLHEHDPGRMISADTSPEK